MSDVILFDVLSYEDFENPIIIVTPEYYFEQYECIADFVDEDVFEILDNLNFDELSDSTFEYTGKINTIEHVEELLLSCDFIDFEKSEQFSNFIKNGEV